MKTKRIIGLILVLVAIFGVLLIHRHITRNTSSSGTEVTNQPTQASIAANNTTVRSNNNVPPQGLEPKKGVAKTAESYTKAILEKNVLINFWGRVVDQDNSPLAGVKIVFSIRQWKSSPMDPVASTQIKSETLSDTDGRFQLADALGDTVELETSEKEGYRFPPKARYVFSYGDSPERFNPNPNAPIVIRLWKTGEPAPLVSNKTLFGFIPDGRAYTLNLLTNKKLEGDNREGDLVIKLKRPEKILPREKYSWGFQISAVGGGIVEATDEFLFAAPDSGYQAEVSYQFSPDDPNWAATFEKTFYIRARDGAVYGVANLLIRSKYNNESAILIESHLNPTSSRNLQP